MNNNYAYFIISIPTIGRSCNKVYCFRDPEKMCTEIIDLLNEVGQSDLGKSDVIEHLTLTTKTYIWKYIIQDIDPAEVNSYTLIYMFK